MTQRILIFNWHEGYINLLARTGYQFDVAEVWKGHRFGWIKEFTPVPENCRLISEDEAFSGLKEGRYDRVVSQNIDDLLLVYEYRAPIIQLFHTKFSYMTALLPEHAKKYLREKLIEVISLINDITLVFVSSSKKKDWGFEGEVLLPGIDPDEYGSYHGSIEKVLRVGNGLTLSSMKHIREKLLGEIPCTVIGDSPNIPEALLPSDRQEYRSYLQGHRLYLSMLNDKDDDGYNLSMLEAMATGMPVVSVANATSPLINGVNGYISDDNAYLRERINELLNNKALADALGKKARETVIEKFPVKTFIENWKRVLEPMPKPSRGRTLFEKNLLVLKERNPGLSETIERQKPDSQHEIVKIKSGKMSLKVDNILLHSLYDPEKEAEEWVTHYEEKIDAAASIVVLGFGLGYHIAELCKRTEKEIIVFEPRLEILSTALQSVCLSSALKKIRIVTGERIPSLGNNPLAVLQHKPSVSISRRYFEKLLTRMEAREKINKGIKILVVGPLYGGSLPIAVNCSSTLKKMGHRVELLDNSRFAEAMFFAKNITKDKFRYNSMIDNLSAFLTEAVLARCETFKPDLVFVLAQAPMTVEGLKKLKNDNIPTAFWFVEDFRVMNYWRNIAGHYDYFFTIQKGALFNELKKAGARNYHYLPLAANQDVHRKIELTDNEKNYYGSDVSFVGAGYYNRRHLFKGLIDYDFKIWGTDWDMNSALAGCVQRAGERVDTDDIVRIFNSSKININLHSSTYHKGINPFGDFVNPRTFELASCGAFQLIDNRSELADFFEQGEEIIVFEGLEDLRQKITYYLDHTEEREKIAEKSRQRVIKEHTYKHRMQQMLDLLADSGFQPLSEDDDGESVEALIEEAGPGSELSEYLSRFMTKERITLSDIVKDIEESEGDLTRTEALMLTMNEFVK